MSFIFYCTSLWSPEDSHYTGTGRTRQSYFQRKLNWCSEAAYKKNITMHMMQPKKFHLLLRWDSTMEGNKP